MPSVVESGATGVHPERRRHSKCGHLHRPFPHGVTAGTSRDEGAVNDGSLESARSVDEARITTASAPASTDAAIGAGGNLTA